MGTIEAASPAPTPRSWTSAGCTTGCSIIDTWHSVGLHGTGSHDCAVTDCFIPASHGISLRECPQQPEPLYSRPFIALAATILVAVPPGIARYAVGIAQRLAHARAASHSKRPLGQDTLAQASRGRAEAPVRSGGAFLYRLRVRRGKPLWVAMCSWSRNARCCGWQLRTPRRWCRRWSAARSVPHLRCCAGDTSLRRRRQWVSRFRSRA